MDFYWTLLIPCFEFCLDLVVIVVFIPKDNSRFVSKLCETAFLICNLFKTMSSSQISNNPTSTPQNSTPSHTSDHSNTSHSSQISSIAPLELIGSRIKLLDIQNNEIVGDIYAYDPNLELLILCKYISIMYLNHLIIKPIKFKDNYHLDHLCINFKKILDHKNIEKAKINHWKMIFIFISFMF